MASALIQEAISVGAPAYNAGDIAVCAEIYATTATELLSSYRSELAPEVIGDLKPTIRIFQKMEDKRGGRGSPIDKVAWAFRSAFDAHLQSKYMKQAPAKSNSTMSEVIAQAISVGVPAYNSGDHGKCAQIYKDAARRLVEHADADQSSKMMLNAALQQVEQSRDANGNAWALRRALDATLANQKNASLPLPSRVKSGGASFTGGLLHDFTTSSGLRIQSSVVNDTVMGGRSESQVTSSKDGALFEGNVTRRGGGGFASVRMTVQDRASMASALRGGNGIAVTVCSVRGCREWKLSLSEGWDRVSWQADFTASTSEKTHRIPFSEFVPTHRGRQMGRKGLTEEAVEKISSFGLMLSFLTADGRNSNGFEEGPFAISISRVEVY